MMKYFLYSLIGALFLFSGCTKPSSDSYFFSFGNDMEGWEARGIDLELGETFIEWSIQRTQEMAEDGSYSIKFYLENSNDAGKIWIERPFVVKPNCPYRVNVEYAFASADFGNINLWRIITGVVQKRPQTRDVLVYQDDTGNGSETYVGHRWLEKSYDFNVISSSDGMLYVIIGIWGTWETPRTYYLDSVHVTFIEE